jgi:hypothetical protein
MIRKRVAGLLGDLYLAGDEDGGEGLLDDGPEDGDGGADDGEVDFETGEDDGDGGPPGEVDVGVGGGFVFDDGVEAPDGGEDDAGERVSIAVGCGEEIWGTYIPPRMKMPDIATMFFMRRLGLVKMIIGVMKTVRSNTMFRALWLSNRLMNPWMSPKPKP